MKTPQSKAEYYKLAQRTWDERSAHTVGRIRFLQTIIVLLVAAVCILFYAFINKKNVAYIPYVIEINDNELRFAGFVQNRQLKATDAEIIFYIKRFVTNLFSITSDSVLLKDRLSDVYNFIGPLAQTQVTEFIIQHRPIEKSSSGLRVDIRFNLFEKLTERTWRCEWLEETRDKGMLQSQVIKSGTFTYSQEYPQTQIQAESNPSGIFFTEYFVTERR
jgi:type IV secretion system protein VirB5